jgi:hypothetical protein
MNLRRWCSTSNRNTRHHRSGESETPVVMPSQSGVGSIQCTLFSMPHSVIQHFHLIRAASSTCFLPSSTLKDAQNALSHVAGSQPRPSAPTKTVPIPRILLPSCKQTIVAVKCPPKTTDSPSLLTTVQTMPSEAPRASLQIADTENSKAPRKRLGMGRGTMGYPNKKFKVPEP